MKCIKKNTSALPVRITMAINCFYENAFGILIQIMIKSQFESIHSKYYLNIDLLNHIDIKIQNKSLPFQSIYVCIQLYHFRVTRIFFIFLCRRCYHGYAQQQCVSVLQLYTIREYASWDHCIKKLVLKQSIVYFIFSNFS